MNARAAPSETFARILDRLQNVKSTSNGWSARCPVHDDRENSLSVGEGEDDRVLLMCHAGCQTKTIVQALDLQMQDLFPNAEPKEKRDRSRPPTLAELAGDKRLPLEFLQTLGLREYPAGIGNMGGIGT